MKSEDMQREQHIRKSLARDFLVFYSCLYKVLKVTCSQNRLTRQYLYPTADHENFCRFHEKHED